MSVSKCACVCFVFLMRVYVRAGGLLFALTNSVRAGVHVRVCIHVQFVRKHAHTPYARAYTRTHAHAHALPRSVPGLYPVLYVLVHRPSTVCLCAPLLHTVFPRAPLGERCPFQSGAWSVPGPPPAPWDCSRVIRLPDRDKRVSFPRPLQGTVRHHYIQRAVRHRIHTGLWADQDTHCAAWRLLQAALISTQQCWCQYSPGPWADRDWTSLSGECCSACVFLL